MDNLKCARNSEQYHKQTILTFAAEHASYYFMTDPDMRDKLVDIRLHPESYQGFPESNVQYLDLPLARQYVQLRYCMELKPMCAKRSIQWNDESLVLSGCFDGLEDGEKGGLVWVHVPYTRDKRDLICRHGWNAFLDKDTCRYLEHLMLIASSNECMITMSDGTFENSVSCEYQSRLGIRHDLLDQYACFQRDLRHCAQAITRGGMDA